MSRYVYLCAMTFCFCVPALGQSGKTKPARSFELTPVAPPKPALKYQFLYDDLADTIPGNAALLYLDAVLLMNSDARQKVDLALEAEADGDTERFNALADELKLPNVMQELELAARRSECD